MNKKKIIIISIITIMIGIIGVYFFTKEDDNLSINEKVVSQDIDERIFKETYVKAEEILKTMSLEEKIGQLILARYPEKDQKAELEKYKFGGYILFERDFKNKTENEIKDEIASLKDGLNIPILVAVDEEGGKVVRISSNSNLVSERFKSPNELYNLGGFDKIKEDTIEKSKVLENLGINLNLAPVVDVSTNEKDYIYQRTLGKDKDLTSVYAKTVIEASKEGSVSYTLKHFPGYASNKDTHNGISVDNKSYEEIVSNDFPPFIAGIKAGAEAVMVSHNIVTSIDKENPASLSKSVHEVLRNELGFTGVIITDDLDMGAISNIEDATVKAILAGNDLIIVTDYEKSIKDVKKAVENGIISEDIINEHALQILSWKYYIS